MLQTIAIKKGYRYNNINNIISQDFFVTCVLKNAPFALSGYITELNLKRSIHNGISQCGCWMYLLL